MLDGVLSKITLQDLLGKEEDVDSLVKDFAEKMESRFLNN
jgi:hypothetical protein